MSTKAKLSDLNKQLHAAQPSKPKPKPAAKQTIAANVPRGERANFLKLTITMPAEMLSALRDLGIKRKSSGEKDTDISSLLREAAAELLQKHTSK